MDARRFFMLALLLPVLGGLLARAVPSGYPIYVGHLFGGLPYLLLAFVLAALIEGATSLKDLLWLSLLTPPVYALALILFMEAIGVVVPVIVGFTVRELFDVLHMSGATRGSLGGDHMSAIFAVSACALLFGYLYVAAAWTLWKTLKVFGVVREGLST